MSALPQAQSSSATRSYLMLVLYPIAAILLISAVFNGWVDPYALRNDSGRPGFNDQKTEAYKDRLHKTHAVRHEQPEIILLGSSRVGMAMNPHHPVFAERIAYNFGMTGANVYELWRSYQHCQAVAPIQEAILGLDFFMFHAASLPFPTFAEERLRVHADGRLQLSSFYHDYPPAWWSLDASQASIETIRHSRATAAGRRPPASRYDRGLFDEAPWHPLIERMGHGAQFWLREKDFLWAFLDFRYQDRRGENRQLQALEDLLRALHQDEVRTQIFIPPIHARMLVVIDRSGLAEVWHGWKQDLARINAMVAEEMGEEPFPLWDFATIHSYSTEEVPELWDLGPRMRWYWEGSHFKTALGDRVLDRMYGRSPREEDLLFGLAYEYVGAEQHTARVKAQLQDFAEQNTELFTDIAGRVKILQSLKDGSFDASQLAPEQRAAVEAQIRALGGG